MVRYLTLKSFPAKAKIQSRITQSYKHPPRRKAYGLTVPRYLSQANGLRFM